MKRSAAAGVVAAHCKARLAGYKLPKVVIVTDTIPRTSAGKVQKHLLKAQLAAAKQRPSATRL